MEEMQLEIGVSKSFLSYSFELYGPLATRSWIGETWRFLSDSAITVFDPFDKPQLACSDDCFLMERFVSYGYRGTELLQLNHCRMHLHALRLSDLCSADGRHITDDAMEVQTDSLRTSPFSWPRTHRPELKDRSLWRSALGKVFTRSTAAQVLLKPLSPFSFSCSSTWIWNYSPMQQRLFVPTGSGWDFYHVSAGRHQSVNRLYHHGGTTSSLPPDARAATVKIQGHLRSTIVGAFQSRICRLSPNHRLSDSRLIPLTTK